MTWMFRIAGVLVALLGLPALFFFGLYLSTGEEVPLRRAKALYRWTVVVGLGSFNIWIFTRVFQGLRALM